ncbi:MAG: hypothetical protein HY717_16040 [Planctomycetes bacterium]|nr:hypothetical protein [Planctomycetota bacterium]
MRNTESGTTASAASIDPSVYPPSPENAPPLAAPTASYRARVFLVLLSLFLFLALYVAMVIGSGYLVCWIWQLPNPRGKGIVLKFGAVFGAAMLFLFFLKGLFKSKSLGLESYARISERDEPISPSPARWSLTPTCMRWSSRVATL